MQRQIVQSGTRWESEVGYARAVRAGGWVCVSGTTAVGADGRIVCVGDPYGQTLRCLSIIEMALQQLGARLDDVVRTRMFVRDIEAWQEIGRAHAERLGSIRPATSMVEVSRFIAPEILVEIEADALVGA